MDLRNDFKTFCANTPDSVLEFHLKAVEKMLLRMAEPGHPVRMLHWAPGTTVVLDRSTTLTFSDLRTRKS